MMHSRFVSVALINVINVFQLLELWTVNDGFSAHFPAPPAAQAERRRRLAAFLAGVYAHDSARARSFTTRRAIRYPPDAPWRKIYAFGFQEFGFLNLGSGKGGGLSKFLNLDRKI